MVTGMIPNQMSILLHLFHDGWILLDIPLSHKEDRFYFILLQGL